MNISRIPLIVLFVLSTMTVCPVWGEALADQSFIETLREHKKNGTERDFSAKLREVISEDEDGELIKQLVENSELNSAIFYNLDAAPEQFLELILAFWLEDELQWGSRGGMYYSPATQLDQWLRNKIRPQDTVGSTEAKNLYFVLEDKHTRMELAKVLRESYSDEELDSDEREDRRAAAWNKIVDIVDESFPRLLEEDEKRRAEAAKEPKPEPGQFLKKLKQANAEGAAINNPSGQANANTESARWTWILLALVAILGGLGFVLRDRITRSITRRRS